MTILEINNLSKSYQPGNLAVRDVSLSIGQGECLGLVGESGCGKSTLARCVLGVEEMNDGTIAFNGLLLDKMNRQELRNYRRNIQTVFQNPTASLNPKLKIKDSLLDPYLQFHKELQLEHFTYTTKKAFVEQLLETVELPTELGDRYPHELSGGQKQRVTIARAISIEPKLIVLDEPTASLDVLSQGAILDLLVSLQKALGMSYLFISHDLAAVYQLSQRIAVMKDGELLDLFQREDIYGTSRHNYTKELISIF
ncbi:ABC transporter ATP-binding protein [Terribacillus saccharophilus]|uniref:Dipeptide/oligopeptide/nickel ABC transporter ATP-binding protein n=1 Tax=Terribacillus saccharophilus TaxID=361277 RepID=A0A268A7B7_9BACI|nr:dipeptide/oligopeptide/nickel ABC transporter ATP-binding protein [Terribacillus saccharophilus]PAD20025.1 dipeptide/oligopeptide/nickel ABC transporter ATP-binding protein [Terribacillus saccharophilus]PAF17270.1 dipeptide/oligopeptide/nickel ABC transporter ATP-binding protein [Terribacillus saccharophilus]PAF40300.1 dipeptide/oligopeptide/nickel ABC transporter ATP-binding protein [Terribacillus saccharophilus]